MEVIKMFLSNEEKRSLVLHGNLYKGIIILSLPIIFNNLMQTLYNLIDTFFVGQISSSDTEVAAVGGVWPITFLVIGVGMGLSIAGTSLMSQNIGANNRRQANFVAGQLFTFAIILGVILMAAGLYFNSHIISLMGIDGEAFQLGTSYLNILFYEVPFIFAFFIFTAMRQAYGDTMTPMIFTVISVVLNIILDPIFILDESFTVFGLTFHTLNMGVEGAALATVLSKVVIVPVILYYAFFDKKSVHINPKDLILKLRPIVKIIKIAMPISLSQAFTSVGFIVLNAFIFSYGEQTFAAFNISNRINSLIMMPAMGVGNALAFYVGQNIGNNNFVRAKEAFRASMVITLSVMFAGMAIMLPKPSRELIVKLFLSEPETIKMAIVYMLFVGFNTPLMGIFQNLTGVFQGAGKTLYVFILSVSRLWVIRIPLIYVFKNYTNFGSNGIWYAMIISNVFVCVIGFYFYLRGKWEKKIIMTDKEAKKVIEPKLAKV